MKAKGILVAAFVALALAACTDDTGLGPGRQEGYLYFNVGEGTGWADGNRVSRAAVEAPMKMECSLEGQPIYLHTEVTPTMSPQLEQAMDNAEGADSLETRGIRYTNDVFSISSGSSPKISNIGVYASRSSDHGVILDFRQIGPDASEAASGTHYDPYYWNVKEEEISDVWDSGTADFYGYAPYFSNPSTDNGLSMAVNGSGVPVLTYTVPADVTKQLDILTAKQTSVPKNTDVELEFDHVMSAIKFKFKYGSTPDGTPDDGGTTKDNFRWSDGLTTYDVKVTNIQITGVYKEGTWLVGADPYDGARWTVNTSAGTGNFSYAPAKTLTGETSPVDLNPDAGGNVFMMLPQQVPAGAKVLLTCELTPVGESTATKNMSLAVNLLETDGTTPKTWLPGYTYTYTMSLSDFVYVFDYNTATAKNYGTSGTAVGYNGTYEENVFIRSYKMDSKGNKTNVNWKLQYQEYESTAVGEGTDHEETWKDGSNGWIHVYDRSSGTYTTEVLTTPHTGANEGNEDNEKLFKIEVGSIMTPVIDLSMWDQYQENRWKGRSTSNCYIVAGPGTYRIPLIYGNAWTNGRKNPNAYSTTNSGSNLLSTFLNYKDVALQSVFIKEDVGRSNVKDAVLIWEEGDGTSRTNTGGNGSNEGTVVKVISTIDNAVTGEDAYNTDNTSAGTLTNCDYLQFEVDYEHFNYGNAVVGIRDNSDKIIWSWHIWMVDPDWFLKNNATIDVDGGGHPATYASTNIGWVDGGVSVPAKTRSGKARLVQAESDNIITIDATQEKRRAFTTYFTNVLYQWGRKDPMRGNVNTTDMQTDNGAPRGVAGVKAWSNGYSTTNGTRTVGAMIQEPNTIYGTNEGDLYPFATSYFNLWATNLDGPYVANRGTWSFFGKTIYDPSPVGYCVPPSKYLTQLSRSKFAEIDGSAALPIICNYTDGSSVIPFHASGVRTTTNSYDGHARGYHQPQLLNAANGFYHTATPYSRDENWQLHLYFYSGIDTHNFIRGDMSEALSVLPVVWSGETVEKVDEDPATQYLTFKFAENGYFSWNRDDLSSTQLTIQYQISTDNGKTFGDWQSKQSSAITNDARITGVTSSTVIRVKGTNSTYCNDYSGADYHYNYFSSTAEYEVSGNIMSLIYGDSFAGQTALTSAGAFCYLFSEHASLLSDQRGKLVGADNLILPATTLTTSCYEGMFHNCSGLTVAPKLPATVGATNCYKSMFEGCSNLLVVNCMLTSPSTSYTSNWLNNVNRTADNPGTFYYNTNVSTSWPTGTSGIPEYWNSYKVEN